MVLLAAAAAVLVVAVLALLAISGASKPAPPKRPKEPQPPTAAKPTTPRQLPASCKATGDPFGANPAVPGGIRRQGARATYHYYGPAFDASTVACADAVRGYGNKKLMAYPWTAYCLDAAWSTSTCGKCLRVTNRGTGASVVTRVVDSGGCSPTGLDLDPCAFDAIDTDRAGYRDGHVTVDVQEVRC